MVYFVYILSTLKLPICPNLCPIGRNWLMMISPPDTLRQSKSIVEEVLTYSIKSPSSDTHISCVLIQRRLVLIESLLVPIKPNNDTNLNFNGTYKCCVDMALTNC